MAKANSCKLCLFSEYPVESLYYPYARFKLDMEGIVKIAIGSDERTHLTDLLIEELEKRGHEVIPFGSLNLQGSESERTLQWAEVGRHVGEVVSRGDCEQGVVCCWTGTGVSIAANKVQGIRAALCADAATADGARRWNDANILAISLRLVSDQIAREILDAWFRTSFDEAERINVERC